METYYFKARINLQLARTHFGFHHHYTVIINNWVITEVQQ